MKITRIPFLILLLAAVLSGTAACDRAEPPAREQTTTVRVPVDPQTATARGSVVPADGSEARGIMVYAEGTSHLAITDREGRFAITGLQPALYSIRAMRTDLQPMVLGDVLVKPDEPAAAFELGEFTLQRAEPQVAAPSTGTVRGRVLTTDPGAASQVVVSLAGTEFRTVPNSTGSWALMNVPAGDYRLRLNHPDYRSAEQPVTVAAGENREVQPVRLTLQDPTSPRGRTIVGSVSLFDTEGNPVTPVRGVTISVPEADVTTQPDETGSFQISGLSPQIYTVSASAEGYLLDRRVEVDLGPLETAEVDLVLRVDPAAQEPLATIVGRVLLDDGEAPVGITVSVVGTNVIATTDQSGIYQLSPVPEGTHTVMATMNGYERGLIEGIEIVSGDVAELPDIVLERDVEAPVVVGTVPEDGERDVTIEDPTYAIILFSQTMDPVSTREAISVSPDVDHRVFAGPTHPLGGEDRAVVEFAGYTRDGQPMKFDQRYTITVAETATNLEGVPLEEAFSFRFETGSPEIIATLPPDNADNVVVVPNQPIKVFFNAPVDIDNFEASDVRIRPELNEQPRIYVQDDPYTGWSVLFISATFPFEEDYRITIGRGIQTITGDRIANIPYTFTFSTAEQYDGGILYGTDTDRRERREEQLRRR